MKTLQQACNLRHSCVLNLRRKLKGCLQPGKIFKSDAFHDLAAMAK